MSFKGTLQALTAFRDAMRTTDPERRAQLWEAMFNAIAWHRRRHLNSRGSLALSNSVLVGNRAIGGAGASGVAGGDGIGGGLALENNSTATITSTAFLANLAQGGAGGAGANGGDGEGGGIAVAIGGASDTSSVSLSNSLLFFNVAQGGLGGKGADGGNGEGGGMFVGAAGGSTIDPTDILVNLALGALGGIGGTNGEGIGGGLYVTSGDVGVVTLHKTTVALNFASTQLQQDLWHRDLRLSAIAIFARWPDFPQEHHWRARGPWFPSGLYAASPSPSTTRPSAAGSTCSAGSPKDHCERLPNFADRTIYKENRGIKKIKNC